MAEANDYPGLLDEEAEESGSDISSDSNDEEPQETAADRAFVDDEPEDEDVHHALSDSSGDSVDDSDTVGGPKKKRRRMGMCRVCSNEFQLFRIQVCCLTDVEENLDEDIEDDIALVEENLGFKLNRVSAAVRRNREQQQIGR